jgi:glycosyltransferase involved in cell wall biosynthesis
MKIMIDATSLARTITGIENYTKNLVENMISTISDEDELYLLFRGEVPYSLNGLNGFKPLICPFNSQILCEQIWIPLVYKKVKPDVIHFPAFPPSFLIREKIIFTVHDATMWKFSNTTSVKNKLYMKPLSVLGIKRAKKILTVSNSSVNDLTEVFPNNKNKIINTGISISPTIKAEGNINILNNIAQKYNLPNEFFLTVGSLEPRKNLIFLVKAYNQYIKKYSSNLKLVITGRSAWGTNEITNFVKENNIEDKVIFTGYVPDEDLNSLYTLASYFVYPSIYEGFGLPVLEAMACGTPVIISNSSSLPEVADDAAVYFDPYDLNSLIQALTKVTAEKQLKYTRSQKSLERRKEFNWETISENIYKQYKDNEMEVN